MSSHQKLSVRLILLFSLLLSLAYRFHQYLLREMKICFIVSARCTNTVTMDHFPKLAKFPGLFCHCCFRQVSFLLGDKKVVAGCWFLFFARGGGGNYPHLPPCCYPRLCTYVQVDNGLQWGHVKQKPFLQI